MNVFYFNVRLMFYSYSLNTSNSSFGTWVKKNQEKLKTSIMLNLCFINKAFDVCTIYPYQCHGYGVPVSLEWWRGNPMVLILVLCMSKRK